jgi:hypothetical protein
MPEAMTVAINPFVRRQTKESIFSYTTLPDAELINRVRDNLKRGKVGYRNGVFLVPVPPDGFFSAVITLESGDYLGGAFEPRRDGELAQKQFYALAPKQEAVKVDVVIYRHDVLAENNERSSDAFFEIVSINAYPTEEESPITPEALMANFFRDPGASDTQMSDSEFVGALRKSRDYWRDKTMTAPESNPKEG